MKYISLLITIILLNSSNLALAQEKYELRLLTNANPTGALFPFYGDFAERVKKRTNGEVQVKVITARALNIESNKIPSQVLSENYEMGFVYAKDLISLNKNFLAFDVPFLFRSYEFIEKVLSNNNFYKRLTAGLSEHNLDVLALTFSGGLENLTTKDKIIKSPKDLKGLNLGLFGSPVDIAWASYAGANVVKTAVYCGPHTRQALQNKPIDGIFSNYNWLSSYFYPMKDFSYTPHNTINELQGTLSVGVVFINNKFIKKLPPKYREILEDEGKKLGKENRIYEAKTVFSNLKKGFVNTSYAKVVSLSKKEKQAFVDFFQPLYPQLSTMLDDKKFIGDINKFADSL